ncbi:MAG: bifunctional hydroxymethylpyrimidine kinase/phosphomethylpyrimidine kinase [Butyrivibrio sp.]|nr:bifunctional hydroxymethylpyrimidine kinase/phosphomethylpyrimidine kinase [Butyrivibrio sp.]
MRVAAINDLSGLGRCSLLADISVFSAMGIETCAVPIAVLSAQTGFSSYYCKELTGVIPEYAEKYKGQKVEFDGIITGFMLNETQAGSALEFIKTLKSEGTRVLVDPVLGDDGKRYMNFSEELLAAMKEMVKEADIITPNITELCLLADIDPTEHSKYLGDELIDYILRVAEKIRGNRKQLIAVTGIPLPEAGEVGNLIATELGHGIIRAHSNGVHYSGTGDLFAAVLFGGILNGKDPLDAAKLAGDFISASVEDAVKNGISGNEGIAFEKHLGMLI